MHPAVLTDTPSKIHVRDLTEAPDDKTPRYWFANDIFLTHFFNAVSSTFPEGERFFIRSVRHYADNITDEQLRSQITAFYGQEGRHSREHDSHIKLLHDQGYKSLGIVNRNQRVVMNWLNQHAPRVSLALTTAIEHVTAIFAHEVLSNPEHWIEPIDPSMQRLWVWHAIEETEHKAVAYDVYQQAVGSVWLRRFAMLDATFGFLAEIFLRHSLLLIKDRAFRPSVLGPGFVALFGSGGFLRRLAPSLKAFYAADFHPWQLDNRALLEQRLTEWDFTGSTDQVAPAT